MNDTNTPDKRLPVVLYTTRQTAHALGVSPQTVQLMQRNGQITAYLKSPGLRGHYFYHPDEIRRLLATAGTNRRIYRARKRRAKYELDGMRPITPSPRRGRNSGIYE
jgi:hypothetical protein